MRRLVAASLLLAMIFATAGPASAYGKSFIRIKNETDKYVWVTVYSRPSGIYTKTVGAWCIAPGANDDHGVTAEIKEVRAEVSTGGCQREPRILDKTYDVAAREVHNNDVEFYGFVKNAGGIIIFLH
jgi:hypothetical protein